MKKFVLLLFLSFCLLNISTTNAQETIQWMTFAELEVAMEKEAKPAFVDFWTSWCGWCKRMDATTFKDPKIVAYINENFYPVKFNAEEKETVVFRGAEFKYKAIGRRGYNELAHQILKGKLSYPSYSFLQAGTAKVLTTVRGYQKAVDLLPILTFIGDEHYQNSTWKEFKTAWDGK